MIKPGELLFFGGGRRFGCSTSWCSRRRTSRRSVGLLQVEAA
jgi:hypothetical protein